MNKHAERLRREAQELRAGRKQTPDKDSSEMTPEELDAAIENQRAEVQRLKERELQAAREATQRGPRRGLPFGASKRKIT